jgi:CRP-like cAMP-binding protein
MIGLFNLSNDPTVLSEKSKDAFLAMMRREEHEKGHVLVKPGTICNEMFFIEKGLTRTFYYKDDKDITDWFSTENTIACSILSFFRRIPDRRGIELLENSTLWSLHHDDLENLCKEHHEIERFTRGVITYGLLLVQERFDDLHFATAAERYRKLLHQQPSILQRAPLGMIASYLGITQETLSRIRAQHIF